MRFDAITQGTRSRAVLAVLLVTALLALLVASPGRAAAQTTVWLCRPGAEPAQGVPDPCENDRTATVVTYIGSTRHEAIEAPAPSNNAPVDCFYVYPTVSEQESNNANYEVEETEIQIAIDQASRFSQVCRVYAPIYPQLTIAAINATGIQPTPVLIPPVMLMRSSPASWGRSCRAIPWITM